MELSATKQALLNKWLQGELLNNQSCICKRPLNCPVPLSYPQQRQLFLEFLEPGTAINNLSSFLLLNGTIYIEALEQSIDRIIARHNILRTRYSFNSGLPVPIISENLKVKITNIDLQNVPDKNRMTEARRLAGLDVLQPINPTRLPLLRVKLFVINNAQSLLLVVIHHSIADGWSFGVFMNELIMYYNEITEGVPAALPDLSIQYDDFAYWQTDSNREKLMEPSVRYWKKQLGGNLPVLELPVDRQRGARQSFQGGTFRFVLSVALTSNLEKISREQDVTLFMTLLTAFNVLLHRISGQDEILIGSPVADRSRNEFEVLIGVFINTIVFRTNFGGDPEFIELLRHVKELSSAAYAHQDLPFEKLVELLNPSRDLSRTPLFQVVFNLQNAPPPRGDIHNILISTMELDRGVSQFDLSLIMTKKDGQLHAIVEYNSFLFKSTTIARMFHSFELLLNDATRFPYLPVSKLKLVADDELRHFLYTLNQTELDFPRTKCVHQLFEEQVDRAPDSIAIIHASDTISYKKLNQLANALANKLQTSGVQEGVRVGVLMEKSWQVVEVLLAILKAGGTYVPIHTSCPLDRIDFIIKDSDIRVLITNVDVSQNSSSVLNVVDLRSEKPHPNFCNPRTAINGGDLAYIMYTSGSTGQPKGVMVQHAALVNLLCSMQREPGMQAGDIMLSLTAISFDIAALELFLPLITGSTIIIADKEMLGNPVLVGEAIKELRISIMQATPAYWQLLLDSGWKGAPELKALCGGDSLSMDLAEKLIDRVGSLWNMYGPTETTIWSSVNCIHQDDSVITIGRPIANTQIYILDRNQQPLPVGVIGELYIGGEGLAKGYLNQPKLTEEKFIADCFRPGTGSRLFMTGDRARYHPDGSIEVLSRIDDQVKIHGHRIELGEITAVIKKHPAVKDAIVVLNSADGFEKRVIAYYVSITGQSPEVNALKNFIREQLPAYMMPSAFLRLDQLPLNANGKVDRRSLPLPEPVKPAQGYVAPALEQEKILAGVWQYVLGVELVGIDDNFFDLGGASIQVLQVVALANVAGLQVNAENVFEYQTIASMVEHLNHKKNEVTG